MDLDNDALGELDFVIGSVHSYMNQEASEMTDRLMKALECPHLRMLGHPTGRLRLNRDPSHFDFDQNATGAAREKLRAFGISPPHGTQPHAANVVRFAARAQPRETIACPRCGSLDTTETSHFSSTACKALYRCLACREPFDYFKPH